MLEKENYCDYKTCVALKKLGYKEKTLAYYTSEGIFYWRRAYIYDVAIPDLAKSSNSNKELHKHVLDAVSLYEAQKWLREEKGVNVYVRAFNENGWHYTIQNCKGVLIHSQITRNVVLCHSYEEALSEGLRKAVKILKKEH